MKINTKGRKKARRGLEQIYKKEELLPKMFYVFQAGKQELDAVILEMGTMLAEAIMDIEQEERPGTEYYPLHPEMYKWAYKRCSIYLEDQKIPVKHPRLRGRDGEIQLQTYEALKKPEILSEELLRKVLRDISLQKYKETVMETARAFGVSPSSLSRHMGVIKISTKNLTTSQEAAID